MILSIPLLLTLFMNPVQPMQVAEPAGGTAPIRLKAPYLALKIRFTRASDGMPRQIDPVLDVLLRSLARHIQPLAPFLCWDLGRFSENDEPAGTLRLLILSDGQVLGNGLWQAAANGHVKAQSWLGHFLIEGYETFEIDQERGVALLTKAAQAGDANAQLHLGYAYQKGRGIKIDLEKAYQLFAQAALAGSKNACEHAGYAAESGAGLPPSDTLAVKWYALGASLGDAACYTRMARAYIHGKGIPADDRKAFLCADVAARSNHPEGMYTRGWLEASGKGVPMNVQNGLVWIIKAANAGMPKAMFAMGNAYRFGAGVERDVSLALKWFEKAAAAGHTDAYMTLAEAYFHGSLIGRDEKKATEYTRAAADLGNCCAQYMLSEWLEAGHFGKKDTAEAKIYRKKAALQGCKQAIAKLIEIYPHRIGEYEASFVRVALDNCITLHHEVRAMRALGEFNLMKIQGWNNPELAAQWLERAGQAGDADALHILATHREETAQSETDRNQAKALYQRAAEKGSSAARSVLLLRGWETISVPLSKEDKEVKPVAFKNEDLKFDPRVSAPKTTAPPATLPATLTPPTPVIAAPHGRQKPLFLEQSAKPVGPVAPSVGIYGNALPPIAR
jgi:uncharacterized protein